MMRIRGATSKGKLHHDQSVIFGPALLDAYGIETSIAKYPRIVLSRGVYQDFQQVQSSFKIPRVRLASDGPPFLDVFAQFAMLSETEPTIDFLNSKEVLQAQLCQRSIQNLVDDSIHEPKHYEKLHWLAVCWNSVVALGGPRRALEQIVLPIVRDLYPDFDFDQGRT
jgi:hypothetical protein